MDKAHAIKPIFCILDNGSTRKELPAEFGSKSVPPLFEFMLTRDLPERDWRRRQGAGQRSVECTLAEMGIETITPHQKKNRQPENRTRDAGR